MSINENPTQSDELSSDDYIIPSVFDKNVVEAVSSAVKEEAQRVGCIRASAAD